MLILTRRMNQGIVVQGDILIKVLGIERDRVKIGIAAPPDIHIVRQELLAKDRRGQVKG